jgi:hypothetical protein
MYGPGEGGDIRSISTRREIKVSCVIIDSRCGTDRPQHVYHFYGILRVLLGRKPANRRLEKALRALKQKGHILALHLAPGERQPSTLRTRTFDIVIDSGNLVVPHQDFETFARDCWLADVSYDRETCALIFGTMNRAQQYQDCLRSGHALIDRLNREGAGLEFEEVWEEGGCRLKVFQNPRAGLSDLCAQQGWADRREIWVDLRGDRLTQCEGVWLMGCKDTSGRSVLKLTKDLKEERPWLAKRWTG